MGNIIRQDKTYPLDSPPEIRFTQGEFINSGQKFSQGDVFSRPTNLVFRHFAVIYGFDYNHTLWLLELNQDGVRFVTFLDFMAKYKKHKHETRFRKVEWNKIYKRAIERRDYPYSARNNNCEAFINFLFYGSVASRQSEVVEVIAEASLDLIFEIGLQTRPIETHDEERSKHIKLKKEIGLDKLEIQRSRELRNNTNQL